MEIQEMIQLFKEVGVTIVVLAYFIYRDWKFMSKLDSTLDVIKEFLKNEEREVK